MERNGVNGLRACVPDENVDAGQLSSSGCGRVLGRAGAGVEGDTLEVGAVQRGLYARTTGSSASRVV